MDPLILIVVACVVSCVLAALIAVAYFVVNKPVEAKAALLSSADLAALVTKFNTATSQPVPYSNILDYSLQHGGHVIESPITGGLTIRGCNNLCNGTKGCQGFQFNATSETCELLSNVANTFLSYDQGWNIFVRGTVPDFAMGPEQPNIGYSSGGGAPLTDATTYDQCVPYCFSNASTCKGMSISPTGCNLIGTSSIFAASAGTNSWKVVQVTHGQGLSSSPSPS